MAKNFNDIIIYDNVSLAQIFKEIRENSLKKNFDINLIVNGLKELSTKDAQNAVLLIPMIAELMDAAVKNDDSLVKLATVVSRMNKEEKQGSGEGIIIPDHEKRDLLEAHRSSKDKLNNLLKLSPSIDKEI